MNKQAEPERWGDRFWYGWLNSSYSLMATLIHLMVMLYWSVPVTATAFSPVTRAAFTELSKAYAVPNFVHINGASAAIADNGSGMPQEIQQRVFDPFFTTKPAGKGTGMGMSISYQIVTEKHQGKLICLSKPGQGSEFIIQMPAWQQSHATVERVSCSGMKKTLSGSILSDSR